MKLKTYYLTKNDCYKAAQPLTPKGIIVHSSGANNPNLKRYVGPDDGVLGTNQYRNHWNQPKPDGKQVCVHAFIGKDKNGEVRTYQTLLWTIRGWHAGGSGNNSHIGFEICEDDLRDVTYFRKVFIEATELCAYLCKQFGLTEKNILGHYEAHLKGIASNHADPRHWFSRHGETMDSFRAEVKKVALSITIDSQSVSCTDWSIFSESEC